MSVSLATLLTALNFLKAVNVCDRMTGLIGQRPLRGRASSINCEIFALFGLHCKLSATRLKLESSAPTLCVAWLRDGDLWRSRATVLPPRGPLGGSWNLSRLLSDFLRVTLGECVLRVPSVDASPISPVVFRRVNGELKKDLTFSRGEDVVLHSELADPRRPWRLGEEKRARMKLGDFGIFDFHDLDEDVSRDGETDEDVLDRAM